MDIYEMKNAIQNYAWGSKTFLPELMGNPEPSDKPQAELWMGTHIQGISQVKHITANETEWISLAHLIQTNPQNILGSSVANRFDKQLPFLFKVLAINHPLSIQVHPNRMQAKKGYQFETQKSYPLTESYRNFKDDQDKPELICALTPLWAMCGFRPYDTIYKNFQSIENKLKIGLFKEDTIPFFFTNLMNLSQDNKIKLIDIAVRHASNNSVQEAHWQWVLNLSKQFPDDVGVLSPLFLNIVCLKPFEALYIQPGILHAYLDGNAIEIMNNSDNVIRGGLTVKHIDIDTLLNIVNFNSEKLHYVHPTKINPNEYCYQPPSDRFMLSRIDMSGDQSLEMNVQGPEILLCTKGEISIRQRNNVLPLKQGHSAFVAHSACQYHIEGKGEIFKGFVRNEDI